MPCKCHIQKLLIRSEYQYDPKVSSYLDYNATTAPDRKLLALSQNLSLSHWAHPKSAHGAGSQAYRLMNDSLEIIQSELGKGSYRFYCSGSQANFYVMDMLNRWFRKTTSRNLFLLSSLCHPSVFQAAENLGLNWKTLHINSYGQIQFPELEKITIPVVLYSPVNHETGAIDDGEGIKEWVGQNNGYVIADAVQALPRLELGRWKAYCDLYVISGHKFHVPPGTAMVGGPLLEEIPEELSTFGETLNPVGHRVFAEGLKKALHGQKAMNIQLELQEKEARFFWDKQGLEYQVNSPPEKVPGVLNISLPWVEDMEDLFLYLGNNHIAVSRFCACEGTVKGPSKILTSMGLREKRAETSLRISTGRDSKLEDWLKLGRVLIDYRKKVSGL